MTPRASTRRSSIASLLLLLAAACGPLVVLEPDTEGDDESAGDSEASGTTAETTSTTVATSSTTSATTASTTTPPDPTTVSTTSPPDPTGGDEPGYCAQVCRSVADCTPPGGNPIDWSCVDGFCEYVSEIPPCEPANCDDLMIGICTEVDGWSVCATPCADDSMCIAGFTECTGVDDAGNSICAALPCNGVAEGEPCDIQGVGLFGVCLDGVCVCTDDAQCTFEGFGCNA